MSTSRASWSNNLIITVHAKPKSSRTRLLSIEESGAFVIALRAPAERGLANKELVQFLAKMLKVPKTSIRFLFGASGKTKHLSLPDTADLSLLRVIDS